MCVISILFMENSSVSSSSSLRRIYADQSHRSTSRRGAPSHIFISAAASQRACGSPSRHPLARTPRQEPRTAEPRKPLMTAVMAAKLEGLGGCRAVVLLVHSPQTVFIAPRTQPTHSPSRNTHTDEHTKERVLQKCCLKWEIMSHIDRKKNLNNF